MNITEKSTNVHFEVAHLKQKYIVYVHVQMYGTMY